MPGVFNLNSILSNPVKGNVEIIFVASVTTTFPERVLLKMLS